ARGEICGDKAEAIANAVNDLPETADPDAVEAAQADLVERAKTLTLRRVRIRAQQLIESVAPADAERLYAEKLAEREQSAYDQATLTIRKGADGMATIHAIVPNWHADLLKANVDSMADPRRDHVRGDTLDSDRPSHRSLIGRAFCDLIETIQPSQLP